MAKSKTLDLPDLPADVKPAVSSIELIARHIERLRAAGSPQKAVALDAGFAASFLSDIKAGRQELPFTRIVTFAVGAKLTREERFELLHARLAEEHGGNIDLCLDTLAIWADELCSPARRRGAVRRAVAQGARGTSLPAQRGPCRPGAARSGAPGDV